MRRTGQMTAMPDRLPTTKVDAASTAYRPGGGPLSEHAPLGPGDR